jgi:hypothetical protein
MIDRNSDFAPGVDVHEVGGSTFRAEFWMWEAIARELPKPWCDRAIENDLIYLTAKHLHDGTPYPGRTTLSKRWEPPTTRFG